MGGDYEVRYTDDVQTQAIKYYSEGGEKIAMRSCFGETCGDPTYLLTDHLGSIAATTDASGNLLNQQRYKPFGEVRTDLPNPAYRITITDFGYTGQRALAGLMDYHARWYDPGLARFVSADTLVPDPGDSMSWDRYSYVFNNPLSFIDPTGHFGKHREDRGDYWNKRNQVKVKSLEARWDRERSARAQAQQDLRALWKSATLERSFAASFGTAPTGRTSLGIAGACLLDAQALHAGINKLGLAFGLGLGGKVNAGLPGGLGGGLEGIYILDERSISLYDYGGPVFPIGVGASAGPYLVAAANIHDSVDYSGRTSTVSLTVAYGHGATLSYFWAGEQPFSASAPQSLAMGYSPGVALEIDYAAFQYNEIWSSNNVP